MDIFVARQPIFDVKQQLFAYELLFRNGNETAFSGVDGDEATSEVICRSFFAMGMENITGGRRAFINFTGNLLIKEIPLLLPNEIAVVEVLETVEPSRAVVEACKKLKRDGYLIALDDFVFDPRFRPLLEVADIVKVDFSITKGYERKRVMQYINQKHLRFLAEKVETREDFEQAVVMGYSYFQGYFFSKPVLVKGKDIPNNRLQQLRMLQQINNPDMNFDEIEKLVRQDVALTYQLLKLINSSKFGMKTQIHSLKQALVLLGKRELAKWISLMMLRSMGEEKPSELLLLSMVRARFAENVAIKTGMQAKAPELFMMGMFSLIDVFMERPLPGILAELPIAEEIKKALLGEKNTFRQVYDLICAYEKADWDAVLQLAANAKLAAGEAADIYQQAVEWADNLFRG
jgi:EAL and modified HD-GYP domain-containing signal transduction protein